MQTSCISSAHTDDSLSHHSSLTEHKFKDKIIKNFKYDDCRVLKQVWHPSKCKAQCDNTGDIHMKLALVKSQTLFGSPNRIFVPRFLCFTIICS